MKEIDTYNKIIPHAFQKQLELKSFFNSPEMISVYGKAQEAANRINSFLNSPEIISAYGKAQETANRVNSFFNSPEIISVYGKAQEATNRMNSFLNSSEIISVYGKVQDAANRVNSFFNSPGVISAIEKWQGNLKVSANLFRPQIKTINESLIKFNTQWQDINKTSQSFVAKQVYDCIKDLKLYSPSMRNIDDSLAKPLMANELADDFEELDFYVNKQGVYIPTTITDKIISTISDFPYIVKNAANNIQKKVSISLEKDIKCYTSAIIVLKILLEYYNIDIGKEANMILDFLLLSQNR